MKKSYKSISITLTLLTSAMILAGCQNVEWSWWATDNIQIVSGINLDDAKRVVDSSYLNANHFNTKTKSYSYETYYRDYLGSFSTEGDANIIASSSSETKLYSNDVLCTYETSTEEANYLNAHSVSSSKVNRYLVGNAQNTIVETIINDYGYSTPIVTMNTYSVDSSVYSNMMCVGATLRASDIAWTNATYGFASNDQVIVEEYSSANDATFRVAFTNTTIQTVTNTYRLYRFASFIDENGEANFALDYSIERVQVMIGYDIFNEPLANPFELSLETTITSYTNKDNGLFDITTIPTNSSLEAEQEIKNENKRSI